MIEKIMLDYLTANLDVPVYMETPLNAPKSYIVLEKTGSSITNHIKEATIAVQSIAPTLYEAAELNEIVKETMCDAVLCEEVTKVKLDSDYNFTNTQTKTYRYQAVFDITHY